MAHDQFTPRCVLRAKKQPRNWIRVNVALKPHSSSSLHVKYHAIAVVAGSENLLGENFGCDREKIGTVSFI